MNSFSKSFRVLTRATKKKKMVISLKRWSRIKKITSNATLLQHYGFGFFSSSGEFFSVFFEFVTITKRCEHFLANTLACRTFFRSFILLTNVLIPPDFFYFLHKCDVLMRWSETEMGHCCFFFFSFGCKNFSLFVSISFRCLSAVPCVLLICVLCALIVPTVFLKYVTQMVFKFHFQLNSLPSKYF